MPYKIFEESNRFCVWKMTEAGEKSSKLKCYASRGEALAYQRALYANVGDAQKKGVDMGDNIKAKTKTEGGMQHPMGDYLVVEDSNMPSTWHLRVKKGGKADPRLMGAAHAALTVGYRGNKYEGPKKAEALAKLKKMYEAMNMTWPEDKGKEKKSVSLWELECKVRDAIREKAVEAMDCEPDMCPYLPVDVFVDFAIVKAPAGMYQIGYTIDAESYDVTLAEPQKVKIEYIPDDSPAPDMAESDMADEKYMEMMMKKSAEMMTIKSIGVDRVGAYAVLWGDENRKDLTGQYFTPQTGELTAIFDGVGKLPYLYHHGLDKTLKTTVIGVVDTLKPDSVGLWYEAQLKLSGDYKKYVNKLLGENVLKTSTQTFPIAIDADKQTGEIRRWPIVEITATPTPAEYRMQPVATLKSLFAEAECEGFACVLKKYGVEDGDGDGQGAEKARLLLELEQTRFDIFGY